jgi:hypothetical protein
LPIQISIGYHSLNSCSHLVKEEIVNALLLASEGPANSRRGLAYWELSVCYFVGFGVEQNFEESARWLNKAALSNVKAALVYRSKLLSALGQDPSPLGKQPLETLEMSSPIDPGFGPEDIMPVTVGTQTLTDEGVGSILTAETVNETRNALLMDPSCLNSQDAGGNTALVLAAKRGNSDIMEFLLSQTEVDASLLNDRGENALHFLGTFSDEAIPRLTTQLVDKGADIFAFADPPEDESIYAGFIPRTRCDTIQRAVLCNSALVTVAIQELLRHSHMSSRGADCIVCAAGSQYRKAIAICMINLGSESLSVLLRHGHERGLHNNDTLSAMRVWHNGQLMTLWNVLVYGWVGPDCNIPEKFCRALLHGASHVQKLRMMFEILWADCETQGKALEMAYSALQAAAEINNLDAVMILSDLIRTRGVIEPWVWMTANRPQLWETPIVISIRKGTRQIFSALWPTKEIEEMSCLEKCSDLCPYEALKRKRRLRHLIQLLSWGKRETGHKLGFTAIALSYASVAAHRDPYFV